VNRITLAAVSRAAVLLALLALSACSALYPVQVVRTGEPSGPPRPAQHVEVLFEAPQRKFLEIARLTTDSINYDSPGHAVARLREVAGELGADAILVEDRGTLVASAAAHSAQADERAFGFGPPPSPSMGVAPYAKAVAIRWVETP
jgi:hypothetical protein